MEVNEEENISTKNGSIQEKTVTCSRCGQLLRHPQDWVRGENGAVICATCYQEILFPNIHYHAMEEFD